MFKWLLRVLRLDRLFVRWGGMRGGDFQARIYEALVVGFVLGAVVSSVACLLLRAVLA